MPDDILMNKLRKTDAPFIAGVVTDIVDLDNVLIESLHILEIRVDMLPSIEDSYLDRLVRLAKNKGKAIIFTLRSQNEGGMRRLSDDVRERIYSRYIDFVDAIDVEISSERLFKRLIDIVRRKEKRIIGSYHDFNMTPQNERLEEIFHKGKNLDTDIVKIATMVNSVDELIRLIEFTIRHRDDNIITLGMGDRGRITRILNPVIGSLITFGSLRNASAPGQLTVEEIINYSKKLF